MGIGFAWGGWGVRILNLQAALCGFFSLLNLINKRIGSFNYGEIGVMPALWDE